MKIQGKVWVVTGGAQGMGRELTRLLLAKGARVAAVDLDGQALGALAEELGAADRLSTHVVDITDRQAVAALPDAVIAQHGHVDGVINNAGIIHHFYKVNDLGLDVIDRVMNVNFFGTVQMTKAFLPHLLQRPEAHIANVSSMGGFTPVPGQVIYGASKAAVKLLTEGLYAELLHTGVAVSVIMPGGIETDIVKNSGATLGNEDTGYKLLSAAEAARIIVAGLEADKLHILVGKDAKALHLMQKIAPRRTIAMLEKQMQGVVVE